MVKKTLVGKYEYETGEASSLGEGTYSKVRLCTDNETGKQVAVKIMSVENLREEKAETQVRREVAIARMLNHPNVVGLYDFIDDGKNLYVVLEYVDGGDVARKLNEVRAFSENEARKIFQDLIVGLQYCHATHRIAHRDLKPENLLIDKATGAVKISDFGLANISKTDTNGGPSADLMQTVCGTTSYSAPEVLREQGYDGMKADLWSCGVILFQLLSGTLPFEDANLPVLYTKIERADYRAPRDMPEGAKALIAKLLVTDVSARYTLDQIIADPWFSVGFDRHGAVGSVTAAPPPTDAAVASAFTKADPVADLPDDGFDIIARLLTANFNDLAAKGSVGIQQSSKRFTFLVRASLEESRNILIAGCVAAKGKASAGATPFEVKGFVSSPSGLVTYNAKLVATISPSLTYVSVTLGRGDIAFFGNFIRSVAANMGADKVSAVGTRPV